MITYHTIFKIPDTVLGEAIDKANALKTTCYIVAVVNDLIVTTEEPTLGLVAVVTPAVRPDREME